MKRLIAGLTTGLCLASAPAWADSWKDESGHGWRGSHTRQQVGHADHRGDRRHGHSERHHPRLQHRHWGRHYDRQDYRHHHPAPRYDHRHYRYRDPYYRYYAPGAYTEAPSVWFSWTLR